MRPTKPEGAPRKEGSGWYLEMFLGQKLAEREWTRQCFHSKQSLSCPLFFRSIPILNGLPDRSKPVQGFSHAFLHPFFPIFSLFCLSRPFKNHLKAKLHHFWQKFNRSLSKPIQRYCTTLGFLSRGRFFPVNPCFKWSVRPFKTRSRV